MILRIINASVITLASLLFFSFTDGYTLDRNISKRLSAMEVLTEVHKKLVSAEALQYDYLLELNYISENYSRNIAGTVYIDFQTPDSVLGFKYQLEDEKLKQVYNGTESFYLDKERKTMNLNLKPTFKDFTGLTPFYNSLVTLRKALPAVIADKLILKTLSDTSFANKDFYLVKLVLDKRSIERLGGFSGLTTNRKVTYDIIIDKSNYMPVQIIQGNSVNEDFARSTFNNITTKPADPSELSWYYSTYTKEYVLTRKEPLKPLENNSVAPIWQLPLYGGDQTLSLNQLNGKVVLLEFWNKNCGYCISAVPKINALNNRFKSKDFAVYGINMHDRKEDIDNFYQKNKPNYMTVFDGGKVADEYGIGAFPMVVLINKKGRVLYTGGIDKPELQEHIKQALRQ